MTFRQVRLDLDERRLFAESELDYICETLHLDKDGKLLLAAFANVLITSSYNKGYELAFRTLAGIGE
jgi:hypothetical protein